MKVKEKLLSIGCALLVLLGSSSSAFAAIDHFKTLSMPHHPVLLQNMKYSKEFYKKDPRGIYVEEIIFDKNVKNNFISKYYPKENIIKFFGDAETKGLAINKGIRIDLNKDVRLKNKVTPEKMYNIVLSYKPNNTFLKKYYNKPVYKKYLVTDSIVLYSVEYNKKEWVKENGSHPKRIYLGLIQNPKYTYVSYGFIVTQPWYTDEKYVKWNGKF